MASETLKSRLLDGATGPITVLALAQYLRIKPEQLRPMVELGYLRTVMAKPDFPSTVVACPKQAGRTSYVDPLEWLRQMFQPIHLRPFISFDHVRLMIEGPRDKRVSHSPKQQQSERVIQRLRKLCGAFRLPVYIDPVFGELITIETMHRLTYHMGVFQAPSRKDRAGILSFLLNSLPPKDLGKFPKVKLFTHVQQLNWEIKRIAQLKEPERTIRALALYEAWQDARCVQECIIRLQDSPTKKVHDIRKLDQRMERMHRLATGG